VLDGETYPPQIPPLGARSLQIGSVALMGQEVGLDTVYEQDSAAHGVRDGTGAWRAAALRGGIGWGYISESAHRSCWLML
jgi:hypothetical protein